MASKEFTILALIPDSYQLRHVMNGGAVNVYSNGKRDLWLFYNPNMDRYDLGEYNDDEQIGKWFTQCGLDKKAYYMSDFGPGKDAPNYISVDINDYLSEFTTPLVKAAGR